MNSRRAFAPAGNPGDWAMHCHMTHHTMNQMGHNAPNLIGVRPGKLDKRVSKLLPGYMAMGESGMADMAKWACRSRATVFRE
jgi:hypothetical protein